MRQLSAIMFADIVGYTALMQENEQQAKSNRDRHRSALEFCVNAHKGKIVQYYGDGSLSTFSSSFEAVSCAINIQLKMQSDPRIPVRIGIHTGDIVFDEDGIYGDGVNIASRIESFSVAGSVMISDRVYDDIKNQEDVKARSMGAFDLKNVKRPVEVFAITNEGLYIPKRSELKGKVREVNKTIAVMPFVNMSADADNEYFSDGITEELINALTRVDGLQVTSRTSSFSFKGQNEEVREIANRLNVSYVLEGSVRKAGKKVRITAQLISGIDGYHLWSENYNRDLEDIFEVQDEISRTIALNLREKLSINEEKKAIVEAPTTDLGAYNLYLQGLFHQNRWTPTHALKAIDFYEQAVQAEPGFDLPYVGIARCYGLVGMTGTMDPGTAFEKAYEALQKALKIGESDEARHLLATFEYLYTWDFKKGFKELNRALELNPNNPEVHLTLSLHYLIHGDFKEATRQVELSLKVDPLSLEKNRTLADQYYFQEDYEEALRLYDKLLELDPTYRAAIEFKGWTYLMMEEYDKAIRIFIELGSEKTHAIESDAQLGYAYALKGDTAKAQEYLDKILKKASKPDSSPGICIDLATVYTGLGDLDSAIDHLETCVETKIGTMVFLNTSPLWRPLKKKKRFRELVKKMGL